MTFEVEVGGRTRTVSVERGGAIGPDGGRFRVRVDDQVHEVDARRTGVGLTLILPGDGRSIDVALTEHGRGEWLVQLPHVALEATVDARRRERGPAAGPAGAGAQRVTAPMPGRVVRLLVKVGDEVALRQGLVVVEAMKMENELGSPKAGRVKDIAVTEGQSVEAGRLLVVIE
jgi:biotin carboxyl carrier protein